MARPTSSKNIFTLTKYSRATFRQSDNIQNTQGLKGDCDWHHHTQPTLRLLLELRKSAHGVPESLRLRVVWTVDKCHAPANSKQLQQQENNIFEDVDLLVVRRHVHPFPTQGLPLKAVFRDSMVGIRYLPPQARSNNPSEYRRFQITFQSSGDSAALIEAIRDVCPCKPSPANNPAIPAESSTTILNRPRGSEVIQGYQQSQEPFPTQLQSQSQRFQTPSGSRNSSNIVQSSDGRLPLPSPSQSTLFSDLPADFVVPFHQSCQNNSELNLDPRIQHAYQSNTAALSKHQSRALAQQATLIDLSSSSPSPFCSQALQRPEVQFHPQRQLPPPPPMSRSISSYDSGIRDPEITRSDPNVSRVVSVAMPTPPTSSQGHDFSSANDPSRMPPPGNRTNADTSSTAPSKHPLLESLYGTCRLDHFPCDELEQLVAHVVREDGFAELLEKIDTLWQLKTVVNM